LIVIKTSVLFPFTSQSPSVRSRPKAYREQNSRQITTKYVCMNLICQMQTTDKATTTQRTRWQDSEAQHALTTALDKKNKHHKHFQNSI